jgi:hypothetical protein
MRGAENHLVELNREGTGEAWRLFCQASTGFYLREFVLPRLDLNQPVASQKAYELAAGADVFGESYRTRKISNLGLSPEELPARRPGIVYASARCYAYDGPWDNRAGLTWKPCASPGSPPKRAPPSGPPSLRPTS